MDLIVSNSHPETALLTNKTTAECSKYRRVVIMASNHLTHLSKTILKSVHQRCLAKAIRCDIPKTSNLVFNTNRVMDFKTQDSDK
jgi:hypothetical protein